MAQGGKHIGSTLSIALSLAIALALAAMLWPDPADRQRALKQPDAVRQKIETLSVATIHLPSPPPPSQPERKPPKATPSTAQPPAADPAPMVVSPLKPMPVATPSSQPVPSPVKATVMPLKPESKPKSRASKPRKPPAPTVKINKTIAAEGRTLLRLLEHGKGPAIEIAWPAAVGARARLFGYLRNCLGVRVALMDGENRFYLASGRPGVATRLNLDRYSGFMRYPSGRVSNAERRLAAMIRDRHGMASATSVRLFPRKVDAALLGGLNAAIGESYVGAKSIRASYRRDGRGLYVSNLRVDGRKIRGRILLSNRRCSNSGV